MKLEARRDSGMPAGPRDLAPPHRVGRFTGRHALAGAAGACLLGAMLIVPVVSRATAVPFGTEQSLGRAAASTGRYFGAAVDVNRLRDPQYTAALDANFTSVTPENVMKWDATEPVQGTFTFDGADMVFDHATSRGMEVRGHTLVWHAQLPAWVAHLPTADALRSAMNAHIIGVMSHYKGRIYSWDVVNEAFQDGDSGARRSSPFRDRLGDGFIEEAFRTAHSVDPNAKLCYNDYNIDGMNAKSNAVYAMVKDFKARGVPIDCVGFQSHLGSVPGDYQANMQRFADLGVDVPITELDISGSGGAQAGAYSAVVTACLAISRCPGITVWGVSDATSWRGNDTPTLLDGNYLKKPAYLAALAAMDGAPTAGRR
jgi:endo-1,4-beta-xylanase